MVPPKCWANAMERNHAPITIATNRAGAKRVTIDNPTGDKQSSPIVCNIYPKKRKSMETFPSSPANIEPITKTPNPNPRLNSPIENFTEVLGSLFRLESAIHKEENMGAKRIINKGFTDWKTDVGMVIPKISLFTFISVKNMIELPACSKKAQKVIEKKARIMITQIRSRSTLPIRTDITTKPTNTATTKGVKK